MKFLRIVAIVAGLAVLTSACTGTTGDSSAAIRQTVEGEPVFASIARVATAQVANGEFDSSTLTEVPDSLTDANNVDRVLALSADLLGPTTDIAAQVRRLDPEFAALSTLPGSSIEEVSFSLFYFDPELFESDPEVVESEFATALREQGSGWYVSTALEFKSTGAPEDVLRSIESDLAEILQAAVPSDEIGGAGGGGFRDRNQFGGYTLRSATFGGSISYFMTRGGFEDLTPASSEMIRSFEAFAGENIPQGNQAFGTKIVVRTRLGEPEIAVFDNVDVAVDTDVDEIATTAGWEPHRDESTGELIFDEQGMVAYGALGMMARMSLDNPRTGDVTASISLPQGE